jgi:hypothetical protein
MLLRGYAAWDIGEVLAPAEGLNFLVLVLLLLFSFYLGDW